MHLHDQDDVPQIKNLGFAVSPGVHALVAARYNTVSDYAYSKYAYSKFIFFEPVSLRGNTYP